MAEPSPNPDTANLRLEEARHRSAQLSVTDYRVELDLRSATDPDATTFSSTTTIRFAAGTDSTFLDLIAPRVRSIELNGRALDPQTCFDGNRVRLDGLEQQNTVIVAADTAYSRSGEGMHRFTDPVDGRTYLYTQYEPADARRVFANFEQPDLKAPFTFVVTAPPGWQVLSNQSAVTTAPVDAGTVTTFAPTLPMSTYITAVIAGPYHRVEDHWSTRLPDGRTLDVPLAALCRASLAEHFDADAIFDVTRQGLDFFHQHFEYPYPWGKYDQVFVPEYNLGAMENPGCVTFTESYVFRSAATHAQYEGRANTILHEMAHMWFGDLVTMQWWDDLWLKESFADYMGAHASAAATPFTGAWTSFAGGRKAWAYLQDQLPTTHPVVATIDDLEAAKQNFDGITYAKGASVLKQLVAYVGEQEFFAGARTYFREHAYGNTTLSDLLAHLEQASGRDLQDWTRLWLQTAGMATLTPRVEQEGATDRPTVSGLWVTQESMDPVTGNPVQRPHRLAVGLYHLQPDGGLVRTRRIELDVTGEFTAVEQAVGTPAPDLVLVNDDDLTYAKVRLDDHSLATVREHLCALPEPLSRALVWSALWNATRDAALPGGDYLETLLRHAPAESTIAVLRNLTTNARLTVERYLPPERRHDWRRRLLEASWAQLESSPAGSDAQLVWARTVAAAAATVAHGDARVQGLLDGSVVVEGLPMDPDLRWALLSAVAATGGASVADLDAELERDNTASGATHRLAAWAGRPDPEVKALAWSSLLESDQLSNDQVDATITGFGQPLHAELTAPYTDRYFDELRRLWAERSIEIASRLVRGLYPAHQALPSGTRPEDHRVLRQSQRWLDAHEDAPAGLRRLVVEQQDHLLRSLRCQHAAR